jgi:hypothetical protein
MKEVAFAKKILFLIRIFKNVNVNIKKNNYIKNIFFFNLLK